MKSALKSPQKGGFTMKSMKSMKELLYSQRGDFTMKTMKSMKELLYFPKTNIWENQPRIAALLWRSASLSAPLRSQINTD
jgi:hypothetical protein